jgi:predicted acetyltransferase
LSKPLSEAGAVAKGTVIYRSCSLLFKLKSEYGKDMIELLLDRDPNIEITEAVVVAAAKNKYGKNMIELLLDRDPNIEITEAVVVAAAGMV